jgi:hypothetical protein
LKHPNPQGQSQPYPNPNESNGYPGKGFNHFTGKFGYFNPHVQDPNASGSGAYAQPACLPGTSQPDHVSKQPGVRRVVHYNNPTMTINGAAANPNGTPLVKTDGQSGTFQPDPVSKQPGVRRVVYNNPTMTINGAVANPNGTPLVETDGQCFCNIYGTVNNGKARRKAKKAKSKRSSASDDSTDEESE